MGIANPRMAQDSFAAKEVFIPKGQPLPHFEEEGVLISHYFSGVNYTKLFEIPRGKMIRHHVHSRDHHSALLCGQAIVTLNGISSLHTGPCTFLIRAGDPHAVDAMTPIVWACIWENPEGLTDPDAFDHTVIEKA